MEILLDRGGTTLALTLTVGEGPVRGGCVALHPADDGSRQQPLMRHLADTLPAHGVAVLLYDRRPWADGEDVPLSVQAADALAVVDVLRARTGAARVGLWGFSQGAWAAARATALDPSLAFLVAVGCAGVTPAAQMRHGTAEQLRRHGFDEDAVADLLRARESYEQALRGRATIEAAQSALDLVRHEPWWRHAWLPERIEQDDRWLDMDVDPAASFAATRCPTLAVWGDQDPWVPVDASQSAWRRAAGDRLTVLRLPGVGHGPDPADPRYQQALLGHVLGAVDR